MFLYHIANRMVTRIVSLLKHFVTSLIQGLTGFQNDGITFKGYNINEYLHNLTDPDMKCTVSLVCLGCRLLHKPIIVTKIRSYSTSCTEHQTDNIFKPSALTHTVFLLYSTAVYLHPLCLLFLSFWEAPGRV